MEDLDGVIRSTTAGLRLVRYQTGIAEAADIQSVAVVIIVTPEFSGVFTDAVHGDGFDDGLLRTGILGGCWSEHCDGGWPVHFVQFLFPGDVEHVEQSLHVEVPGQVGILLSGGGEDGGQEVYLRDVLPDDLHVQHFLVHHVEADIWTRADEQGVGFAKV